MLILIGNVIAHEFHVSGTDGKRPVTVLPIEICQRRSLYLQPLRRIAFQLLDEISHGNGATKSTKDMYVIRGTAYPQHGAVQLLARATEVFVSFVANRRILQKRTPLFGRENEM